MDMILREKFRNITNAKKSITALIKEQELNKNFKNDDLEYLINKNPYKNNIGDIEHLVVKLRPPYNQRSLYFKRENYQEDDVSYVCCLEILFNRYDKCKYRKLKVLKGFREAIRNTKRKKFFFENTNIINKEYNGICDQCGISCKAVIDHYKLPFQKILDDFIVLNNIDIETLTTSEYNYVYILDDKNIVDKWIEYHDNVALFRVLCGYCNSSLGSYGYKKNNLI